MILSFFVDQQIDRQPQQNNKQPFAGYICFSVQQNKTNRQGNNDVKKR